MKSFLLSLCILFTNHAIQAQHIKTVADLGNRWIIYENGFWQTGQPFPDPRIYYHTADSAYTIIDSLAYTKITYHYNDAIYIRYDYTTNCLYAKPVNKEFAGEKTLTEDEFVLMNGNLEKGDTLLLDNIRTYDNKRFAFIIENKTKELLSKFTSPFFSNLLLLMNPDTFSNYRLFLYKVDSNNYFSNYSYSSVEFNFIYGFFPNLALFWKFDYEMGPPRITCFYNPTYSLPTNLCEIKKTDLDNIQENKYAVYPNPFNANFILDAGNNYNHQKQLFIYNLLGQLVLSQKVLNQYTNIDMSAFTNGIYFLKMLNSDNTIQTYKIIKE